MATRKVWAVISYETHLFPDLEYTFTHALTHEVAYGSLVQERRRVLYARVVEALEALAGTQLAEQVERLAHHALRGEVWEKVLRYAHQDGTERPIPRPHDATEPKACYSGKKKRHRVKNLLRIARAVRILFLSEMHPGSVYDKRIADTTPYPLRARYASPSSPPQHKSQDGRPSCPFWPGDHVDLQ